MFSHMLRDKRRDVFAENITTLSVITMAYILN